MEPVTTMGLEEVMTILRRGGAGSIENAAGVCVFVDGKGNKKFVMDDSTGEPVAYQRLAFVHHHLRPGRQVLPIFLS